MGPDARGTRRSGRTRGREFDHRPLDDDDLQLALYLCYELHYRELDGVDDRAEWDPLLLGFRLGLERIFESALHERVSVQPSSAANDMAGSLVDDDPRMLADVLFGASALLSLDQRWTTRVMDAWREGRDGLWADPSAHRMSVV